MSGEVMSNKIMTCAICVRTVAYRLESILCEACENISVNKKQYDRLKQELESMRKKLEISKAALGVYASVDFWEFSEEQQRYGECPFIDVEMIEASNLKKPTQVGGKLARQTLKEIEE